jgi:cell division septum initiation protein DivIVA
MTDAPEQIPFDLATLQEAQVFKRRKRFYDSNLVDELLEQVRTSYDRNSEERSRLQGEVEHLNQEIERYREFDGKLSNVLLHAETAAVGIRADAEREAEEQLQRARKEADALLAKAREENELLREEAAGLETLRSELRTTYRAFLLAALELIKEHPFDDERPAAEVLETALSPDTQRSADADAGVDLDADSEANADSTARDPLLQVEA